MTMLTTLIPAALTKSQSAFVNEHAGFHLLKPPTSSEEQQFHYETLKVAESEEQPADHIIPSASAWQSIRVAKRPGNPYPERISVGRAFNCDIVLRFAVVSKLHAHFTMTAADQVQLCDLGSSNGTWHNGRRLQAGERVALSPKDFISFGGVHCELTDALGLYQKVSGRSH